MPTLTTCLLDFWPSWSFFFFRFGSNVEDVAEVDKIFETRQKLTEEFFKDEEEGGDEVEEVEETTAGASAATENGSEESSVENRALPAENEVSTMEVGLPEACDQEVTAEPDSERVVLQTEPSTDLIDSGSILRLCDFCSNGGCLVGPKTALLINCPLARAVIHYCILIDPSLSAPPWHSWWYKQP